MAGRLPKCPECEYQVDKDKEEHIIHSKKTYHAQCFKKFERRKEDRNDLHNYICELYRISVPNGFMLKQIKEFTEEYGYTLKGIEFSLRYFNDVEKGKTYVNNEQARMGIGIVPYVYEKTKLYYGKLGEIKQHNMNIEYDNTVENIYVAPPRERKLKLIDLEEI